MSFKNNQPTAKKSPKNHHLYRIENQTNCKVYPLPMHHRSPYNHTNSLNPDYSPYLLHTKSLNL